jgi:1,2-diacylglycerol 3-beta-glucosyltransferase
MMVSERLLPQLSGAGFIYTFIIGYTGLQSLAQAHRKRQEIKQAKQLQTGEIIVETVAHDAPCPAIALLVPCHNEASVISHTIDTLMRLDYPNFTLWVIDDRSTDNTPDILTALQHKYDGRFHWFSRAADATPGKSAVLNDARRRLAQADMVAVFDADAHVEPDFLTRLLPYLADDRVGAVQARKVMSNAHTNLLTICQQYEYCLDAHFQCGRDVVHGAVELRGNGQLLRLKAVDSVGGWNENTVTDDLDLSTQMHLAGWDVRFVHKVIVQEEAITTFLPLLRQRRRWAEGSLVRHLTYSGKLLTSPHVSLRATIDMIAWFTQFLLPIWLVLDYMLLGVDWLVWGTTDRVHLISALLVVPLMSIFFTSSLMIGIRRFAKLGWWPCFHWACTTGTYMTVVWFPVVFWVLLRMLFKSKKGLDWGKTVHTGQPTPSISASATPVSPSGAVVASNSANHE